MWPRKERRRARGTGPICPMYSGTLDRDVVGIGPPAKATDVDVRVSEVMQRYWTNFARTGNPNDGDAPQMAALRSRLTRISGIERGGATRKEGLRRPQCDLFIEHIGGPKAK